jgi:hypothetical protein
VESRHSIQFRFVGKSERILILFLYQGSQRRQERCLLIGSGLRAVAQRTTTDNHRRRPDARDFMSACLTSPWVEPCILQVDELPYFCHAHSLTRSAPTCHSSRTLHLSDQQHRHRNLALFRPLHPARSPRWILSQPSFQASRRTRPIHRPLSTNFPRTSFRLSSPSSKPKQ